MTWDSAHEPAPDPIHQRQEHACPNGRDNRETRVEVLSSERGWVRVVLPQAAQPVGERAFVPESQMRQEAAA